MPAEHDHGFLGGRSCYSEKDVVSLLKKCRTELTNSISECGDSYLMKRRSRQRITTSICYAHQGILVRAEVIEVARPSSHDRNAESIFDCDESHRLEGALTQEENE